MKKYIQTLELIEGSEIISLDHLCSLTGRKPNVVGAEICFLRKEKNKNILMKKIGKRKYYYFEENLKKREFYVRQTKIKDAGILHIIYPKKSIKIIPTGDWHVDNQETFDKVWNFLEEKTNEGYFFIGGGDLVELSHKGSVGDGVYRQQFDNQTQRDCIKKILKKFGHRFLYIQSGNHESRLSVTMGMNFLKDICQDNDIAYVEGRAFVNLETEGRNTIIHSIHKITGILRNTKQQNTWRKFSNEFQAHFYLGFHGHEGLLEPNQFRVFMNPVTLKLEIERFFGIMSPSFLPYLSGYGDKNGYLVPCPAIYSILIKNKNYEVEEISFDKEVK